MLEGTITMSLEDYEALISASNTMHIIRNLIEAGNCYIDDTLRIVMGIPEKKEKADISGMLPAFKEGGEFIGKPVSEPVKISEVTNKDVKLDEPAEKEFDLAECRKLRRDGWSTTSLGKRYGCSPQTILNRLRADSDKDADRHAGNVAMGES